MSGPVSGCPRRVRLPSGAELPTTSEWTPAEIMTDPTTAVVLAAGEGRRLRPLTQYQPKPMLPVANRPIIEYVVDALLEAGMTDIVVVVGHQRQRLQDHLMQRYPEVELSYVRQHNQLGSGDALRQAAADISGSFVVVNGDNIIDAQMVRGSLDRYRQGDVTATVAVGRSQRASDYGAVCIENGRVTTILERHCDDEQGRINVGVYVFDDDIFSALDRTAMRSGELSLTDAIPRLSGRVVPAVPNGVWFDPAYPWDLLTITERLQSAHPELVAGPQDRARIDESARVHEQAVVGDRVIVGPGCEIEAGAVLRNGACLQSDVRVGPNAVINRSQIGADSRVGANAVLRDTVVGAAVGVGEGAVSPGGRADFAVGGDVHHDKPLGGLVSDRATIGGNVTLAPGTRVGPDAEVRHGATVGGTVTEVVR